MRLHWYFQLHNQLIFINEGVFSKPIDEIPTISSNHTFLSPVSTDLVLPHQFTRQFYYRALAPAVLMTTELPKDCEYPRLTQFWGTSGSSTHCASVGKRLCLSSVTLPFFCSPLYPPANRLLYKQPNLTHSNQTSWVGRALFHFDKQHCQQIWEGISLKQKGCLPELT